MADDATIYTELPSVTTNQLQCTENDFFPTIQGDIIHKKIKSAFCKIDWSHLNGLIQFWAPVKTDKGRMLLSTSDQPFVLDFCYQKYRLCSMMYQYSIDDDDVYAKLTLDPMIIIGAPAASAFMNHLPVVQNLRVHEGSPLVRSALECGLTYSLLLPVFYSSLISSFRSSSCVGVAECSVKRSSILLIFNKLKSALESVGLSMFHEHAHECRPYKTICGLKRARYEVEEALEIVCESHDLYLAQVWIAYENNDHVPFSYSLGDKDTKMKQMFAVKMTGYGLLSDVDDDDLLSVIHDYYVTCNMLPLKIGEGLAGKTLLTYEAHFCRNIFELRDNGLLLLLPVNIETECSSLVICLRSIHTGDDVFYAFEFIWPQNRNYFILLRSLLLTLRSCLPSFKFACGAHLGDELRVVDAENSTGTGIGFFKILEGNRISPLPKALEERRMVVEDCISSSEEKLYRVAEPKSIEKEEHFGQRKVVKSIVNWFFLSGSEENKKQESTISSNSVRCPGKSRRELVVKIEYGDRRVLAYLPQSSKFADVNKYIYDKYYILPDSYKLQFLDAEGDWLRMDNEQNWEDSVMAWKNTRMQAIRLRLLPLPLTNLMVT